MLVLLSTFLAKSSDVYGFFLKLMVFNSEQGKSVFEILANINRVFKNNVDRIKWSKDSHFHREVSNGEFLA